MRFGVGNFNGFDVLGVELLDLAKGAAGLFSGAGGLMSGSGKKDDAAATLERQRLEEERRRADASAAQNRLYLGVGAAVVVTGLAAAFWKK